MKHLLCLSMLIIGLASTPVSELYSQDSNKVLLFVRDGSIDPEFMLTKEAGVMKEVLEQAGFEVAVATISGEAMVAGSASLKPDLKLSDVQVKDYVGFIMPCMAASDSIGAIYDKDAVAMVREAAKEGKPVAAQFGAVLILAEAGVLEGKKYAISGPEGFNPEMHPILKDCGGIYSGTGVIMDGNIITSGICPYWARQNELQDGTTELAQTLVKALKAKT